MRHMARATNYKNINNFYYTYKVFRLNHDKIPIAKEMLTMKEDLSISINSGTKISMVVLHLLN